MACRFALAVLLLAGSARAYDLRLLAGSDLLLTTSPGDAPKGSPALSDLELGVTARIDLRDVANRWDFKLDFMGREGFIGDGYLNQLIELSASVRLADNHVKISLGRMKTPGGFWLIVDGLKIDAKYTSWLGQSAWGGIRAFTTGRRDTWMGPDPKVALPVVGTALWIDQKIVTAMLSFSWARDAIDLPMGELQEGGQTLERHVQDEYFLDGNVAVYPIEKLTLSAGFSLGTRYDVHFDAGNPFGATTLGVATLGAVGAYGMVEYRPLKQLRLTYTFNYERVRLIQSQLLLTKADGSPVEAAAGSFQDHAVAAIYRIWHALRAEVRYRLRYRENTDLEHHFTVGLIGDELYKGFGANLSVGVDEDSLTGKKHDRAIYSAGLSYIRSHLDLGVGILFTDGIGSGLTFSTHQPGSGATPTELFPYVLESNRIVYVRAFGTFWKMFAGLDLEENLDSAQVRMLLQIGGAL
jgi:hypothetical protein